MDADRIKELRRKVTLFVQTTLMSELLQVTNELLYELEDGDYWQQRATNALENGTCPICFGGDEGGHEEGCEWGDAETRADGLEFQRNQAQADRDRYLAALEKISTTPKTETVFLGENVASITRTVTVETIQRYADQIIKGGPA